MADKHRAALDAMVRDACEQQAALGRLPAPLASHDELRPIIERLEQKNAEKAGRTQPQARPRQEKPLDQIAAAYRKAGGVGTNLRLVKPNGNGEIVRPRLGKAKRLARKRLSERIRWMVARDAQGQPLRPEYDRRIKELCNAFLDVGVGNKQAACEAFDTLLSDSDRHVGRVWHQPPPRPIYSSAKAKA